MELYILKAIARLKLTRTKHRIGSIAIIDIDIFSLNNIFFYWQTKILNILYFVTE